jgi:hypothetical protein
MMATLIVVTGLTGLLFLMAPVSVAFDLERSTRVRATWRVRWLFGLVRVTRPRPPKLSRPGPRPDDGRQRWPQRRPSSRGGSVGRMAEFARTPGLASRVVWLLLDLIRHVTIRDAYAYGAVGLDDPADTGELYGVLSPLLVAASVAGVDVRCRPDFEQPGLRGACGGRLRVRPASVLWSSLRFLCSAPVLRSFRPGRPD